MTIEKPPVDIFGAAKDNDGPAVGSDGSDTIELKIVKERSNDKERDVAKRDGSSQDTAEQERKSGDSPNNG